MTKSFWIFLILVCSLISEIIFIHYQTKPLISIDPKTKIIYPIDSSKNFDNQIFTSNSALISLLQERESTNDISTTPTQEETRQIKTIYSAVFVVLISLLLRKEAKKKLIYCGLLIYIMLTFYVDVSQEDMLNRQKISNGITHNALDYLINSTSTGRIRYFLNYNLAHSQYTNSGEPALERRYRKLWYACNPNIEQFVYFYIPLVVVFFFLGYELKFFNKIMYHLKKLWNVL